MRASKKTDYISIRPLYNRGSVPSPETLFDNLIWGLDEVCEFTKYAKGTIYNLVSRGEIPYK